MIREAERMDGIGNSNATMEVPNGRLSDERMRNATVASQKSKVSQSDSVDVGQRPRTRIITKQLSPGLPAALQVHSPLPPAFP